MPAAVEIHPAQLPPGARRKLTREDCQALEEAGLLEPERYELIDGELIRKMSKSRLHTIVLLRLAAWLRDVFGTWRVEHEGPISLGPVLDRTNEPEPDLIVLRCPSGEIRDTHPQTADILLVVEIAATTREYDLGAKAALYASAGISEYWVLDLRDARIVVHREPLGDHYESIAAYAAGEAVSPLAAPGDSIRLQELWTR